jgi:hypothetical protein
MFCYPPVVEYKKSFKVGIRFFSGTLKVEVLQVPGLRGLLAKFMVWTMTSVITSKDFLLSLFS